MRSPRRRVGPRRDPRRARGRGRRPPLSRPRAAGRTRAAAGRRHRDVAVAPPRLNCVIAPSGRAAWREGVSRERRLPGRPLRRRQQGVCGIVPTKRNHRRLEPDTAIRPFGAALRQQSAPQSRTSWRSCPSGPCPSALPSSARPSIVPLDRNHLDIVSSRRSRPGPRRRRGASRSATRRWRSAQTRAGRSRDAACRSGRRATPRRSAPARTRRRSPACR